MKTRVYVTIDVECAEERAARGKLQAPLGYDLRVWGRFENQREELGIGLLMRELECHGFRGTFFVEALGADAFGREGLRDVCSALQGRGHDVQLHTHPILQNPLYRSRGEEPPADDLCDYPRDVQVEFLRRGIDLLVEAGVPRAGLLAFRAGNFGASSETWAAMSLAGLRLSSNCNPCYVGRNCAIRFPHASPDLFATPVRGIWELPITCFREAGPVREPLRHLQISAASEAETLECLAQCRNLGIGHVTVVTHSFELYSIDSVENRLGHPNTVNLKRLRGLLRFLAANRDAFEVETVGALAARLPQEPVAARSPPPYPAGRLEQRAARFVEQAWKRVARRVSFL